MIKSIESLSKYFLEFKHVSLIILVLKDSLKSEVIL